MKEYIGFKIESKGQLRFAQIACKKAGIRRERYDNFVYIPGEEVYFWIVKKRNEKWEYFIDNNNYPSMDILYKFPSFIKLILSGEYSDVLSEFFE